MATLTKVVIQHFRSIKKVEINFPPGKPVVLFGPNNAGKSNILAGIDVLLGENWPTSRNFEDTDFYQRIKDFPIQISAKFSPDDPYAPKYGNLITTLNFISYSK